MTSVILKGLRRDLKFTQYALCRLGEELGIDIDDPEFSQRLGYRKVCYLLWAGLLHESQHLPRNKQLKFDAVLNMIPTQAYSEEFNEIRTAVVAAFLESQGHVAATPEAEEKKIEEAEGSEETEEGSN